MPPRACWRRGHIPPSDISARRADDDPLVRLMVRHIGAAVVANDMGREHGPLRLIALRFLSEYDKMPSIRFHVSPCR